MDVSVGHDWELSLGLDFRFGLSASVNVVR